MSNVVSSLIFACRNVDKTQNGDIGRAPVAAAQTINVLGEVTKYNKALAKGAEATLVCLTIWLKKVKLLNIR